jgi:hypothetical protein
MSKVALTGNASGTGTLTVAAPNTNSDYTLTLPQITDTILTATGDGSGLTGVSFQRSYLSGLDLSAAGSTATFGVAVGVAKDSTNAASMTLASAYTKTTSAWAVGTGNGALDTGSIANATWYHVFIIKRSDTGVVDVLISTSATSPTMPANYDYKRRIGAMKTDGSAQWIKFSQNGDEFLWDVTVNDVNVSNLGTTATLYTANVPTGVIVMAKVRGYFASASVGTLGLLNSPSESEVAANATVGNVTFNALTANQGTGYDLAIRTNTSAQLRAVSTAASTTFSMAAHGWVDRRGRDA